MVNYIFNSLTQEQYNKLKEEDKIDDDSIYFIKPKIDENNEDDKDKEIRELKDQLNSLIKIPRFNENGEIVW